MSNKQFKNKEIPFLLNGTHEILKSVTKNTTCFDVIDNISSVPGKLAIYESINGIERKLCGKTKLLKIWRANASSNKLVFIVRKSAQTTTMKNKRETIEDDKQTCVQTTSVKTVQRSSSLTKDKLKQVADLAFYVRYQKSKVQAIKKKSDKLTENTTTDIQKNALKKMTSTSSVNSMDAFLAKADLDKMAQFLSFCGGVTSEKLNAAMSHDHTTETIDSHDQTSISIDIEAGQKKTTPSITRNLIHRSFRKVKRGLTQKFTSKEKTVSRTTSTGTINSTDTGYHSVKSDEQPKDNITERRLTGIPKRHTFIDTDLQGGPKHSTPVNGQTQRRTNDVMENTLTMTILDEFDESDGKSIILQKFMNGQSGSYNDAPQVSTRQTNRNNMRSFNSQIDKCQSYWNRYCDSDSESLCCESDISGNLDEAFYNSDSENDDFLQSPLDAMFSQKRTLRRESAISNLNKFSAVKPVGFDETEDGFDYSFNCSFPLIDENPSSDYNYSFDNNDRTLAACALDKWLCSFTNTRLFLDESEAGADVTTTKMFDGDDSFNGSDEGIGSMASGSVSDCRSII